MEYRSYTPDLEVRAVAGKRLLRGIMIPFGVDQVISDTLTERFERGAFRHQLRAANRVRLLSAHSIEPGHVQIGYATELREDPAGLFGEFRVTPGPFGDQYLGLLGEGQAREWSTGFIPDATRMDGRVMVRVKATAFEQAMVPQGAYGELAMVGEVRGAATIPRLIDTLRARLPEPRFPA
jgi:uncharacterized protein